jgi:hypothetical protein
MTIATIRQRLINYLEAAEDNKVKAIYTLLEDEITSGSFKLSKEQLHILDRERELYLNGDTKSFNKNEALQFIRSGTIE